ncbi:MAG: ABC transporter ATP-binding protein [Pollutimonas bauzanensis]|uniref:Oligopeptide transport system ATP-binding protein n=1 Tax=Pollutimonas bauzanensis TaxID=658167 RepID=A0A1M5ZNB3_9BURK|nr:ABC transporter ATP-binding protein [Pollutimonas bauzanensis]SHI25671.1 oligopeptide transport system ATP-binding protein [Pollutimonas bauzanensis]
MKTQHPPVAGGPAQGPGGAVGMAGNDVLDVRNLTISFRTPNGMITAVNDVSFRVGRGETVALVGESGSGKSVTSLGILRLTPPAPASVSSGQVYLRAPDGTVRDLLALPEREMQGLRGTAVSMVFQEPMTSFNPLHTIGAQIAEGIRVHRGLGKRAAFDRAAELLDMVGIPAARQRLLSYPHEMSGGMRQRAMIAMALACDPDLLIADEPTTALDVTIQAQILELLRDLQQRTRMAMIFITHNLGVVAEIADRVMVMYNGRVVERADVAPLFKAPRMPYTVGLLRSVPRLDLAGHRLGPLPAIPGNVPSPYSPPPGCSFEPRCEHSVAGRCDQRVPALDEIGGDHWVRCVRWDEINWSRA